MSFQCNSLSCCRVCLMTDCRLYDIHEYELADALWQISGTPVSRDELPQYLCAFCFMLLIKCSAFQDMCIRTQKLLKEEMDADYIRRNQLPKRCLNLAQTEVEIIDTTLEETTKYEPEEEMLVETLDEDALVEGIYMEDENKVGTLYILKDVIRNETSDDNMLIERLDEDYSDIETLGCETETGDVLNEGKIKKRKAGSPKQGVFTQIGNIYDDTVDRNAVETAKENKNRMKTMTIELRNNKIEFKVADDPNDSIANVDIENEKVVNSKNVINANTDCRSCDLEEFGKKYNVTLTLLSREQQLEEIATRKKSRNYTESHYQCEDCGWGYNYETTLNNHRAKHDPSIGPYSCDICSKRFKKRHLLRRHEDQNHRMKFCCNLCDFVSNGRQKATEHHAVHSGKTFECKYCGKIFKKASSYSSHLRLGHPERNVVCDECGETFLGQNGLRYHKTKSHSMEFQCRTCSTRFISAEALKTHADTAGEHADLWPCDQCGQNYASIDSLMEHVEGVHPPRHCDECDMTFTNTEAFETHVRVTHDRKKPKSVKLKRGKRSREKPNPCMCDQCGATVRSPAFLVYHMRKHLGVFPYACPHCPKKYVGKYLLNQHLKASHSGEKRFKCPDCDIVFKWQGNLLRHQKVAHLGMRGAFPCPICGRISTTKGSVKVHLRAVHGGAGWPKRDRSKRKAQETTQSDSECNSNSNIAIDRPKQNRSKRKKTQAETIQSDSESDQNIQSDSE